MTNPDDTPQQHRYGYQVEITAVDRSPRWRGDPRPEAHPLVRRLTEDALPQMLAKVPGTYDVRVRLHVEALAKPKEERRGSIPVWAKLDLTHDQWDALVEQANRIHSDPHDLARAYVLDGLRRDAHEQPE